MNGCQVGGQVRDDGEHGLSSWRPWGWCGAMGSSPLCLEVAWWRGFWGGETGRGCRSDLLGQCPRGSRWTLPSRLHCGPCRKLAEWSSWPRLSVPLYELKWETPNQETGPGEAKPVAAGQPPVRLHRDESYSQKHRLLSTQRWKPLALHPVSCVVLPQRRGTAPGLALQTLNVSSTS